MPDPKRRSTKEFKPNQSAATPSGQPEVVDPIWLLKGVGVTILAAVLCGYLSICLLFYQGQWQLVLHPVHTFSSPSSINGIPYESIHFAPDESAVPQLTGWWIPAVAGAPFADSTILFLPGADGALVSSLATLASLHQVGINVFAFDYRGYGQSASIRPSQLTMTRDAESAWQYLTTSRAISQDRIVPYGINVGTSLATQLAAAHPGIPALILDAPYADLLDVARRDTRSRLVPVSLLFHERFPLAQPLSLLHTPKLLLSHSNSPGKAFETAADPKVTINLAPPSGDLYSQTVTRFLDQYLHSSTSKKPAPHL